MVFAVLKDMRIPAHRVRPAVDTQDDLTKLSLSARPIATPSGGQALVPVRPASIEPVEVIDVEYDEIESGSHHASQSQQPVPVCDSFESAGAENFKHYQNLTAFNEDALFVNQPNLKKYRPVGADQPHALKDLQYYKGKMLA